MEALSSHPDNQAILLDCVCEVFTKSLGKGPRAGASTPSHSLKSKDTKNVCPCTQIQISNSAATQHPFERCTSHQRRNRPILCAQSPPRIPEQEARTFHLAKELQSVDNSNWRRPELCVIGLASSSKRHCGSTPLRSVGTHLLEPDKSWQRSEMP